MHPRSLCCELSVCSVSAKQMGCMLSVGEARLRGEKVSDFEPIAIKKTELRFLMKLRKETKTFGIIFDCYRDGVFFWVD